MACSQLLREWLGLFQGVKPSGEQFVACCPVAGHEHGDRSQSLTIGEGKDGQVLLFCFAGHTFDEIAGAVGKKKADAFPPNVNGHASNGHLPPPTLAEFACYKRLSADFLVKKCGLRDGKIGVEIPYISETGQKFCRTRVGLDPRMCGGKTTMQPKGVGLALYGYWLLPTFREQDKYLIIVEGETDCFTLWQHGYPAVGLPGAFAHKVITHNVAKDFPLIYAWQEPGDAAVRFVNGINAKLQKLDWKGTFKVIRADGVKDPSALHMRDPDAFKLEFDKILAAGATLAADVSADGRIKVVITTEEKNVNDQVGKSLTKANNIYCRGSLLVSVIRSSKKKNRVERSGNSPIIVPVSPSSLREEITTVVDFVKVTEGDGEPKEKPAHPPDWCVRGIHARGSWDGIRYLEAVIEAPTMRPNGTVLHEPGYDDETSLLYEPHIEFPEIPSTPTKLECQAACKRLFALVDDFPFVDSKNQQAETSPHKAAWLSALLTPFARHAINGPCPLFLMDANTPGTGKSLLCDIVAFVATGRRMPRTSFPSNDEELRKVITSIVIAGDALVSFDNVTEQFGGAPLDAVLTGTTWKDRVLGQSKTTGDLPVVTIWFASGNNVSIRGDLRRRVVACRLESKAEHPEDRKDFEIPKLLQHISDQRANFVVDCLTILRGYVIAGRPDQQLGAMGSFEEWSDLVRSAVCWATGVDPCSTRESVVVSDPIVSELTTLIEGWEELPNGTTGITVSECLRVLKGDGYETIREVLLSWNNNRIPSTRTIGRRLASHRGRVVNGKMITGVSVQGIIRWHVATVESAEKGGSAVAF